MRLTPFLALLLLAGPAFAGDDGGDKADKAEKKCHWHWRGHSEFAWSAQLDLPVTDFGRAMDQRTGAGLGMQWSRVREDGRAHRTRLEWNLFPEGNPVNGLKTKASNYLLSFDRIHPLTGKANGPYLVGGLGAVRWFVDRTPVNGDAARFHTTKLAVTGGLGWRFSPTFSAEARYLVSSVDKSFDGNMVQLSAGMRF
ncbi:outer membrane protein [Mesoterricola sediminis]|uniref:Outer membrane protein beta-barrel domain-containing protein n=1 Tax=Mesoterricola sediminis TaxID=2927980 RepID=A0AA48KE72_9BACT|nr:hypothetical protein [Mesoterricola sediminis]BDU75188.1 hypothetical protein METESE_01460 [Mesoterricola sediminis]